LPKHQKRYWSWTECIFESALGAKKYHGCIDISLSPADAAEMREGVSAFLLGKTSDASNTSELILELFKQDIPELKRLGLGGLGDGINGRVLSVLLKKRIHDPDFVVYTKRQNDTNIGVGEVLDGSLADLEMDIHELDLTWLSTFSADISDLYTLSNIHTINFSNCSEIKGAM
jgi:hypothetical protein